MSLNEQQVRAIVKDELRKIIDAGLMCTEEVQSKPTQPTKTASTAPTQTPAPVPKLLMSMDELENEPWKASSWVRKDDKDRVARVGEDAFMPRMAANQRLLQMIIDAPNHKLTSYDPPYESITFSGPDGGLIARKGAHRAWIYLEK